jgi:hypothetical protein
MDDLAVPMDPLDLRNKLLAWQRHLAAADQPGLVGELEEALRELDRLEGLAPTYADELQPQQARLRAIADVPVKRGADFQAELDWLKQIEKRHPTHEEVAELILALRRHQQLVLEELRRELAEERHRREEAEYNAKGKIVVQREFPGLYPSPGSGGGLY